MMNLWNSQQSHDRDDYICFSYFLKEDSTFHSFYQTWLKWRFWIHEAVALDGKTLSEGATETYKIPSKSGFWGVGEPTDPSWFKDSWLFWLLLCYAIL